MRDEAVRYVIAGEYQGETRYRMPSGSWTANIFDAQLFRDREQVERSGWNFDNRHEVRRVMVTIESV